MKLLCVAIVIASAAFLLIIVGEFFFFPLGISLEIFGVKIDSHQRRTKNPINFFNFTIIFPSFAYFFFNGAYFGVMCIFF